jgi:hypothetical protein
MKNFLVGLLLVAMQSVGAMELSVESNKKSLDVTRYLEKYSSSSKKIKTKYLNDRLLLLNIREKLPVDVKKIIFVMMHEIYGAKKELFIEAKINEFKYFVDLGNKVEWSLSVKLKDNYKSLIKNDLCQLLKKAENHPHRPLNNEAEALVVYGNNYMVPNQYGMCPLSIQTIDMTETITNFIKEQRSSIIMLWDIINTKLMM